MSPEDLAFWKQYYTDLNVGLDPYNDWTHILDIIEALELAWSKQCGCAFSKPFLPPIFLTEEPE